MTISVFIERAAAAAKMAMLRTNDRNWLDWGCEHQEKRACTHENVLPNRRGVEIRTSEGVFFHPTRRTMSGLLDCQSDLYLGVEEDSRLLRASSSMGV